MADNEKILNEFILINNNVDRSHISYNYDLLKNFIREYQNKIDWYFISKHQILSENLIIEFIERVDWYGISIY